MSWVNFNLSDLLPPAAATAISTASGLGNQIITAAQALVTVIQTLLAFSTDITNPLSPLVSALINQLIAILQDLRSAGAFALFALPETYDEVPDYKGGFSKFQQTLITSFFDVNDLDRPQFDNSNFVGALVLYFEAPDVAQFLTLIQQAKDAFNLPNDVSPIPGPINLTIDALSPTGLVVDNPVNFFLSGANAPLTSIRLTFDEPRVRGFVLEAFNGLAFLIQRSTSRVGLPIDGATRRDGTPLYDIWEPAILSPDPNASIFRPGALGRAEGFLTGRHSVDLDQIAPGIENARYYRVLAVPEDLTLVSLISGQYEARSGGKIFDLNNAVASQPVLGALPDVNPAAFDYPLAILNIYRMAYLYRLDQGFTGFTDLSAPLREAMIPESLTALPTFSTVNEVRVFSRPLFAIQSQESVVNAAARSRDNFIASLREFNPWAGQTEAFAALSGEDDAQRLLRFIDGVGYGRLERLLRQIYNNNTGFASTIQTLYQSIATQVDDYLLNGIGPDPYGDLTTYNTILTLVRLLESGSNPGTPPNWRSLRPLQDLAPDVELALSQLEGLLQAFNGFTISTGDRLDLGLDGVQAQLTALNQIILTIDQIVNLIQNFLNINASLLWVPPTQRGIGGLVNAIQTAPNAPANNPNNYSFGISFVIGGPTAAAFDGIVTAISTLFRV